MRRKGFTFIEIIVVVSIFSILMLAAYAVMDVGRSAWFNSGAASDLRMEIIKTFMRMAREIKNTGITQINLTAGNSSPSLTFKIPQDNDLDGTILDSSGNKEWSNDIIYAFNGGTKQITRTVLGNATVLANDIIALQFTRPVATASLLQIDITAQKKSVIGRVLTEIGQITIKMRN